MMAALLREGGSWRASWMLDGIEGSVIAASRECAAKVLLAQTGVWLGVGPAPWLGVAS